MKMTIRERREREFIRLVEYIESTGKTVDSSELRIYINSFYRLNGLLDRLLYLDNDPYTCNLTSTKKANDRALLWIDRLNKNLSKYNLHLQMYGFLETLESIDQHYTYNAIYYK